MWRTALSPRWLGMLLLAVLAAVVCAMLGLWQLGVARDSGRADALEAAAHRPVVDVTTVATPHQMISSDASARTVTATGTYLPDRTLLIVDRKLADKAGYWLVTPLKLSSNGALLPILRGFVTSTTGLPEPPEGVVTVTGMLAPSEGPPDVRKDLPAGQLQKIDAADLVNMWPEELYSAFVFAQRDQAVPADASFAPGDAAELPVGSGVTRVPPPEVGTGSLNLQNLSYVLQWWFFGLFALVMWWRMMRDAHRESVHRESLRPSVSSPRAAGTAPADRYPTSADAAAPISPTPAPERTIDA